MAILLVLDTNVFVQFQCFDGLPWREISGHDEVVVVVLAAVVRELDKLKLEPRLRDRVRDVLPRLEALFADSDSAALKDGTPARFEHGRGVQDVMQRHGLEQQHGDDRILATILKLQEEGAEVLVVTDDAAVRLRARGLGLAVRPMPDKYRRLGADPLQAENAKLRRELDEVRTAMPRLDVSFTEGGSLLKLTGKALPGRAHRRIEDAMALQPLSLEALPLIYQIEREPPTEADVDTYNRSLEAFRPTYEKYLAKRDEFELFPHRSFAVELTLRNSGGRPAESVQLTLELPGDVTVVEVDDVPKEPARPVGPKLPGRRRTVFVAIDQANSILVRAPAWPSLDVPKAYLSEPRPNINGPVFSPGKVLFKVRSVSNFDEVELPPFLVCFLRSEDVRSFPIPFTIRSHSLPKLARGELHVAIAPPGPDESLGESGEDE